MRQPFHLPVNPSKEELPFTNPYTAHSGVLVNVYMLAINDCSDFIKSAQEIHPYAAEARHIKLYGELVLATSRVCEALIKQLLFCTNFPEGDYRNAALGTLLSRNCSRCPELQKKKHKLSLIGSLAHRYRLCHTYEGCLNQHLTIAKKRRDLEGAHSSAQKFVHRSTDETRKQLDKETSEVGNAFVHMLGHISEIEIQMLAELKGLIKKQSASE